MADINLTVALKALSDPTRLRIFEMLLDKEMCVCEIVAELKLSQPLVSHHLRELKIAGLVNDRREGNWIFNRLNFAGVAVLMEMIDGLLSRASADPKPSTYRCSDAEEGAIAGAN
ncbi:MAG: metalloregulator ArsR/SmtB family transcription factor [Actinobacteria bacterium]|nr:metalloregulator ArsR/SmtB family transcription factor [Actinomycetota bacterium]